MFCYDRGRGCPLLLIHGLWGDHLDWEPVLDPLSRHSRVVAVDLPGFGRSRPCTLQYSEDFFVSCLSDLLNELQLSRVAVAGNSFGGQLAMTLTIRNPFLVDKLILVDTGGLWLFTESQKQAILAQRSPGFFKTLTEQANTARFKALFFRADSEAQRRYIAKQNARMSETSYPEYCEHMVQTIKLALDLSLLDRLGNLRLPVLLIQGEQDPVVSAQSVSLALPRFPNARLALFPNCGHVPQIEQPDKFLTEVNAFLDETK